MQTYLKKITSVQVCRLVDKYISNIFPWQAKSFEHVDILCGLGTTLYNLLPFGTVNTISSNQGLQIFKNFLQSGTCIFTFLIFVTSVFTTIIPNIQEFYVVFTLLMYFTQD